MANVKISKFVSVLPTTLEPNAIYNVLRADGVDMYITTSDGLAKKLNGQTFVVFTNKAQYDAYIPNAGEIVIYQGP